MDSGVREMGAEDLGEVTCSNTYAMPLGSVISSGLGRTRGL